MAGVKTISPEEYKKLPRSTKRELERSLKKQGKEIPKVEERMRLIATVEKDLFKAGLVILEENGVDLEPFLDKCFEQLILSRKK